MFWYNWILDNSWFWLVKWGRYVGQRLVVGSVFFENYRYSGIPLTFLDLVQQTVVEVFPSYLLFDLSSNVWNVEASPFIHFWKIETRCSTWMAASHRFVLRDIFFNVLWYVSVNIKLSFVTCRLHLALALIFVINSFQYSLTYLRVAWGLLCLSYAIWKRLSQLQFFDWWFFWLVDWDLALNRRINILFL